MPTTTTTTGLSVERRELPPIPTEPERSFGGILTIDRFDTYGVIRCGDIYAEVVRFVYWDEKDYAGLAPEITFESRIYQPEDRSGCSCNFYTLDPNELLDLARTAFNTALVLDEARRGTRK
jgi:hypothetical protein